MSNSENSQALKHLEDLSSANKFEKSELESLFYFLLERRAKELEIDIKKENFVKIGEEIERASIVFDVNDLKFVKAKKGLSEFAKKLFLKRHAVGMLITFLINGERHYQVLINLKISKSYKKDILHEVSHLVDAILKQEFPDFFIKEEKSPEDIEFFSKYGLAGLVALIFINWGTYNIDILPFSMQILIAISLNLSLLKGYLFYQNKYYHHRPGEIRAVKAEELLDG